MEPILFLEMPRDRKFYQWGSSMELLKKFIDFLDREADNISEIYLSMHLYNNGVLHEKMKDFANRGIKVTVISIPLEDYDDHYMKHPIYEYGTNEIYRRNTSMYGLAKEIYKDIERLNSDNYILRIFDHTYVIRTPHGTFSDYILPSLRTKSFYIKYKDGKTVTGLTSSNFAVGESPKDELMLLAEDTPASRETTEIFFTYLRMHSVKSSDWQDLHPNYHYEMETVDGKDIGMNYFTAPFIQDSPIKIEEKIKGIISNAQKRIYICAQSLTAFNYYGINSDRKRMLGIFGAIFEKCRQGIEVKCLSQTYVDENGDRHGQRQPINSLYLRKLIRQVNQFETCSYSVNKYVNAKFIVVDNIIIVGTGDYTPAEFLYGDASVDFKYRSYRGKASVVNHYIIMENGGLAEQLIGFFNEIIARPDTYVHGTSNSKDYPDKYCVGTWRGTKVRFLKTVRDHTFTDEECAKLLAEEVIRFPAKYNNGEEYTEKGKLGNLRVYKGHNEVEFISERFKPEMWKEKKIYAVKIGRKTGIFNEWQKCFEQTDKYPNRDFLSFKYCGELEDEPEDVPGSLRHAIREAEEYLGDLVYLGESADYLEDVSWVEDGFLPFGDESETG